LKTCPTKARRALRTGTLGFERFCGQIASTRTSASRTRLSPAAAPGWRTLREGGEAMEVHLRPDVQAKLEQMVRDSGRPSDELVEDAVVDYFDELAHARETLDRRFDDLECGRVTPIDGEEAYRRLMEKTESQRRRAV